MSLTTSIVVPGHATAPIVTFVGPANQMIKTGDGVNGGYSFLCACHGILFQSSISNASKPNHALHYVRKNVKDHYSSLHGAEVPSGAILDDPALPTVPPKTKRNRKLDASLPLYDMTRRKLWSHDFWRENWALDLDFGNKDVKVVERCKVIQPKVEKLFAAMTRYHDGGSKPRDAELVRQVVAGYDTKAGVLQNWSTAKLDEGIAKLNELKILHQKLQNVAARIVARAKFNEDRKKLMAQHEEDTQRTRTIQKNALLALHASELKTEYYPGEHAAIVDLGNNLSYTLLLAVSDHIVGSRKRAIKTSFLKHEKDSPEEDLKYWNDTWGIELQRKKRVVVGHGLQLQPKVNKLVSALTAFGARESQETLQQVYKCASNISTTSLFVKTVRPEEVKLEPIPLTTEEKRQGNSLALEASSSSSSSSASVTSSSLLRPSANSSAASTLRLFATTPDAQQGGGSLNQYPASQKRGKAGAKRGKRPADAATAAVSQIQKATQGNKRRKTSQSQMINQAPIVPVPSTLTSLTAANSFATAITGPVRDIPREAFIMAKEAVQRMDELQQLNTLLTRMRKYSVGLQV